MFLLLFWQIFKNKLMYQSFVDIIKIPHSILNVVPQLVHWIFLTWYQLSFYWLIKCGASVGPLIFYLVPVVFCLFFSCKFFWMIECGACLLVWWIACGACGRCSNDWDGAKCKLEAKLRLAAILTTLPAMQRNTNTNTNREPPAHRLEDPTWRQTEQLNATIISGTKCVLLTSQDVLVVIIVIMNKLIVLINLIIILLPDWSQSEWEISLFHCPCLSCNIFTFKLM